MPKNKTFRFTTEITPETEILLSGRYGQPLSMSLTDERSTKAVRLDTASIIRLQTFLSDYLRKEESNSTAPCYDPTGRALAVIDGDTLDFVKVLHTETSVGLKGAESESFAEICAKLRATADMELPGRTILVFFDTYDGAIRRSLIYRVIRACISYQLNFVRTGDVSRSRPMGLEEIESFTDIDASVISRSTRDVRIMTAAGVFTLKAADASLETPSLIDEGVSTTDGGVCSRKAVLSAIRDIIAGENPAGPFTDEEVSATLKDMGYRVARRTVSKYRDFLGIPKTHVRRVRG